MKTLSLISLLLSFVFVLQPIAGLAFETDQFNLPPVPLADIGDETSEYVEQDLREIVAKINTEIASREACLDKTRLKKTGCGSDRYESKKLAYLRSEDAIAYKIYKSLGDGIFPFTWVGRWMTTHKFRSSPARYKTTYLESIFVTFPTDYVTISPTVNLYGAQFGVDKIEHFFQEGYNYYNIYNSAVTGGTKPDDAQKKAVKWGQMSERTFYGTLVSGVYSNADLNANFTGLKFYLGLTRPVRIGETTRPPILALKDGIWTFDNKADLRQVLLRPFFTEHLNEALNPSIYTFDLGSSVREIVKKQSCRQWFKVYPGLSKSTLETTTNSLILWNGEDYGYTPSKKFVTIANTCFAADGQ